MFGLTGASGPHMDNNARNSKLQAHPIPPPQYASKSDSPRHHQHLNDHAHQQNKLAFYDSFEPLQHQSGNVRTASHSSNPAWATALTEHDGLISDGTDTAASSTPSGKKVSRRKGRPRETTIPNRPTPATENMSPGPKTRQTNSRHSREITPTRPLTTPARTAYAGPTFHASPAASALPIPSFFSKSLPQQQEGSESSEKEEIGGSYSQKSNHHDGLRQRSQESPLDVFFRADREEKARVANGGRAASSYAVPPSHATAQLGSPSPSPIKPRQRPPRHQAGNSVGTLFAMEMDGVGDHHEAPSNGQAGQERLSAIRANTAPSAVGGDGNEEEERRRAKSQALKDLLMKSPMDGDMSSSTPSPKPLYNGIFHGPHSPNPHVGRGHRLVSSPAPSPPVLLQHAGINPPSYGHPGSLGALSSRPVTRSSQLQQEISPPISPDAHMLQSPSPSTPQHVRQTGSPGPPGSVSRADEIRLMEDNLRKVLKLGAPGGSGLFDAKNPPNP
ncbi:MAG: hypothetical protein M1817_006590 [Caeruleum heppii]|nr:MAG: hypothetical protein M1817_006590 [Caeruleum heppii]